MNHVIQDDNWPKQLSRVLKRCQDGDTVQCPHAVSVEAAQAILADVYPTKTVTVQLSQRLVQESLEEHFAFQLSAGNEPSPQDVFQWMQRREVLESLQSAFESRMADILREFVDQHQEASTDFLDRLSALSDHLSYLNGKLMALVYSTLKMILGHEDPQAAEVFFAALSRNRQAMMEGVEDFEPGLTHMFSFRGFDD